MKIVIVEDELPAYNRLCKLMAETVMTPEIIAHLDSVEAAAAWFSRHPAPDVVFMDIHLADGSAFDLFRQTQIDCPVIFTTAYDQYAVEAFKTTGIDYLLKPVRKEELQQAVQKLGRLSQIFSKKDEATQAGIFPSAVYKRRFIIRFGAYIKTLLAADIAYCFTARRATCVRTFRGETYPIDHNLDALEQLLDPADFFRVNRQYLVHLKSIDSMRIYSKARVLLTLAPAAGEELVVSSEKSAKFKQWLEGS